MIDKESVLKEFRQIPGVGKSIAKDFWNLGLRSLQDLKDRNAEDLYRQLCTYQGVTVDKCMLYVFRCAIYYSSNAEYDPELLKWWNWKD
ncbi:MAG: helix-hairpin-helix domain-containing protein [Chlamydiota bacterium]